MTSLYDVLYVKPCRVVVIIEENGDVDGMNTDVVVSMLYVDGVGFITVDVEKFPTVADDIDIIASLVNILDVTIPDVVKSGGVKRKVDVGNDVLKCSDFVIDVVTYDGYIPTLDGIKKNVDVSA